MAPLSGGASRIGHYRECPQGKPSRGRLRCDALTKGAIVKGSIVLSPMFLYFKIKKGRLQVLRNTVHSMSLLLKLLCTTDFTLRKRKCKMGGKKYVQ